MGMRIAVFQILIMLQFVYNRQTVLVLNEIREETKQNDALNSSGDVGPAVYELNRISEKVYKLFGISKVVYRSTRSGFGNNIGKVKTLFGFPRKRSDYIQMSYFKPNEVINYCQFQFNEAYYLSRKFYKSKV